MGAVYREATVAMGQFLPCYLFMRASYVSGSFADGERRATWAWPGLDSDLRRSCEPGTQQKKDGRQRQQQR